MKKSVHILLLLIIIASIFFIRCDCCINCPSGEIDFIMLEPEEGEIIYTSTTTLKWKTLFIHTTRTEQQSVYLWRDSGGIAFWSDFAVEKDDSALEVGPLKPSTIYGWYISAGAGMYDNHYEVYANADSETRTFTTAAELWESGHIYSPTPDSGAVGVSVNPNFAWEVYNPDLLGYDFDIYLGTTTDPPLLAHELAGPYYNLLSDTLEYSTMYYWRVEAYYDTDTIEGPLWEFTTDYPIEDDIFALFEIDVLQSPSGYHVEEEFWARLDTGLALNTPIEPLLADSVLFEGIKLDWIVDSQHYSHFVLSEPVIKNGLPNNIRVYGNSLVPNLNTSVTFPACTLGIISPESFDMVPITGFEVTWDDGDCDGTIWLTLTDGSNSTGVSKEVVNDGLDSLTAANLAPLGGQTGSYDLYLIKLVEENINVPGYKPESIIRSRVINRMPQINITSK